jgi:predicted ATPase
MRTETELIGRTGELALIDAELRAIELGECRVLAISGEPGIGKTRLSSELCGRAVARGDTVRAGRGSELEREAPFAVLIEALDDYLGSLGPTRLEALGRRLPHLVGVFPAADGVVDARPGAAGERFHSYRAIRALLEELAAPRPFVLVRDDITWRWTP